MNNRTFAAELYQFLKDNNSLGHFEGIPAEKGISELEEYMSDLDMVKETIRDIEEIADSFDDKNNREGCNWSITFTGSWTVFFYPVAFCAAS